MPTSRCLPFLALLLLPVAASCTEPGPGRDELATTASPEDGTAVTAAELAAALKAEGVIGMSPTAEEHGANEMGVEIDVKALAVSEEGSPAIGTLAEPFVLEALTSFASEPAFAESPFRLLDQGGDMYQSQHFGWNQPDAEKYLIGSVTPSYREKIRGMLKDPDFDAYYYWFHVYDVGAELILEDVLVIVPMTWDDSPIEGVVIRLSYVHA